MKKILVYTFLLSFVLSSGKPEATITSIGISDKLGIFGVINKTVFFNNINSKTQVYYTYGVFPIPFTGGIGMGLKHSFLDKDFQIPFFDFYISPYVSCTPSINYIIGWNSNIEFLPFITGALAIDINSDAFKEIEIPNIVKFDMGVQIGVLLQYDIKNGTVYRGTSNEPDEIWPSINIKIKSKSLLW